MGISVSKINNIQESTPVSKPKQMAFRANGTNSLERNPQADGFDNPKKHTGLWITLGVLGTAGLAVGFDYWKYKGKHCKEIWNKIKGFFDNKTKPTEGTTNTSQITEFSVADFKKNGKFDKGKALLNDGSGYTGKITNPTKDGNLVLEYENGVLQKSTKFKGKKIDWQKKYELNEDIRKITDYDGNILLKYDTKNKRILKRKKLDYIYDQEGKLQCLKEGQYVDTIFYPDGKTVRCKYILENNRAGYVFYDESGKELALINHSKNSQMIDYPAKNIGIKLCTYTVDGFTPKLESTETFLKSISFSDLTTRNRSCYLENAYTYTYANKKLLNRSVDASFGIQNNKINFGWYKSQGKIVIERGKNKATFNKAANKFESIEGSWTEEELRKLMSEYEAKAKEQIALARQAQRDYMKYEKEILQYCNLI